jgi:hypothetical protein
MAEIFEFADRIFDPSDGVAVIMATPWSLLTTPGVAPPMAT